MRDIRVPTFTCLFLLAGGLTLLLIFFGPSAIRYPDAMEYADMARGLSRGDGLKDRAVWVYHLSFSSEVPAQAVRRAILFPVLESFAFRLAGASDRVAHATSAFFFFLSVLMLFVVGCSARPGRRDAGLVALVAGLLALLDAHSLIYAVSGLSESLFTLLVLIIVWVLMRENFQGKWLLIGLLVGLTQWVRLNGFTLIFPCLLAAYVLDRPRFTKNALLAFAGWAIPLGLLSIRNYQATGMFSFVGLNGAILFNEMGGLTAHGIERRLYYQGGAGDIPPSLIWIVRDHLGEFIAKAWRGLDQNLFAALTAVSPLAWGAAVLFGAGSWRKISPRVRALFVFTVSTALLWVGLFSVGEFEGQRFFVPLSPLVLLLAVLAFREFSASVQFASLPALIMTILLAAVLVFPGMYRLSVVLGSDDTDRFRQNLAARVRQLPRGAVVMTDIPEALAWYGDRAAVWMPQRVQEVEAVRRRASASYLLISSAVGSNSEIEERWRQIYYTGQGRPAHWQPLAPGPLEGRAALFQFD